jgi:hypothetical protein
MIRFSVRGWDKLRDDVSDGQADANDEFRKVVSRGALNIKNDWRARWSGHRHIPHLPSAITYDLTSHGEVHEAEIGPDKTRTQGPLGSIIEFGTRNNAPMPGGRPAGRAEEPRFVRAAGDAAAKGIGGR